MLLPIRLVYQISIVSLQVVNPVGVRKSTCLKNKTVEPRIPANITLPTPIQHIHIMEPLRNPYLKSLEHRGFVQGVTLTDRTTNAPWCHYFGGLRYALPPTKRWRKAQRLPPSYSYGSKDHPGQCAGETGVCPQPSFPGLSLGDNWSEDCFQCNVWVPTGEPPKDGMSPNLLASSSKRREEKRREQN